MGKRTLDDYYKESKRIREEVLEQAELLKGNPLRFIITNVITMRVEITKTDLKTIVSKMLVTINLMLLRTLWQRTFRDI